MAQVPRMRHEGWPRWTKVFFLFGALSLVVAGIILIIGARHSDWWLGLISLVVGALYLFGLLISPRWVRDPV